MVMQKMPFLGDAKPLRRLREDPGFKKAAAPLETCVPAGEGHYRPIGIAAPMARRLPEAVVLLLALRSECAWREIQEAVELAQGIFFAPKKRSSACGSGPKALEGTQQHGSLAPGNALRTAGPL